MQPSGDRKSTRLNSSHLVISYAVFCLKKKKKKKQQKPQSRPQADATRINSVGRLLVLRWSLRIVRGCMFLFCRVLCFFFFFFNDTATTEIYTLSLHDALPISSESIRKFFANLELLFESAI